MPCWLWSGALRDDLQPRTPAVRDVWIIALGIRAVVPVLGLGVYGRRRVVWVVSPIRPGDKCGAETEIAVQSMMPMEAMMESMMPIMPMETLVETLPSMVPETMPSVETMMPMRAMASVESMPSAVSMSSPVSTSGPDIIDNTRPAQQSEHRE